MKAESRFLFAVMSRGVCSLEFSKAVRYILPIYRKYIIIKNFNQLYAVKKRKRRELTEEPRRFLFMWILQFYLTSAPKGRSASFMNLNDWIPKGIPTIVMQLSIPETR